MHRTLAEVQAILPRPHPAVMFREVSDGAVLLQMEDEIYFGLNSVGARIWQLLPPASTDLDDLCAQLGDVLSRCVGGTAQGGCHRTSRSAPRGQAARGWCVRGYEVG